jgi:L-lactate dehydrogenase complex protein LldF
MSIAGEKERSARSFPQAAKELLKDSQLRRNVRNATDVITRKRGTVTGEMPDWQQLRASGSAIRQHVLRKLDTYLVQFEQSCTAAGGQVHWAANAAQANAIVLQLLQKHAAREVLKIKSMTTEEIGLNHALEERGIRPYETDLAELIIQLGKDKPSHIVVPALHKNRQQVREIFQREMHLEDLGDRPEDLTEAARRYLREKFLSVPVAISGANFLVAETGSVCIVESEGNGRMCLTLPRMLIAIAGIEKVIPTFQDLEVFLQTLPRSATGERMNPYNSIWTGTHTGDGPQEFHIVLLDNGRSAILRDEEARQTLKCIRCGACQNTCPVYRQTGGHAYGSVYAGPIGAILTPQLFNLEQGASLPYASSLCGACYEVCPVAINIPEVLIHLRGQVVRKEQKTMTGKLDPWNLGMQIAASIFVSGDRLALAQHLGRIGQKPFVANDGFIHHLPFMLSGWTETRDLASLPSETFRQWWKAREETLAAGEEKE